MKRLELIIQSENLAGALGDRQHILFCWNGARWEPFNHPDNDWTPDKRKLVRLAKRLKATLVSALLAALALTTQASCLPDAPTGLTVSAGAPPPGSVGIEVLRTVLAWRDVRTERAYGVQVRIQGVGGWGEWRTVAVLPRNATSWTDYAPPWGVAAQYRVVASNACGETPSVPVDFALP